MMPNTCLRFSTMAAAVVCTILWPAAASATTCTTVTACVFGINTGTSLGNGFGANAGVSGTSAVGDGVDGQTTYKSSSTRARSGVSGYDNSTSGTYNSGVFAYSKLGSGLHATTATGNGVFAIATSSNGVPLRVQGQTSAIVAKFVTGTGITVTDSLNPSGPGGTGIVVTTDNDAIDVTSAYGYGLALTAGAEGSGETISTSENDGLDISTGSSIGDPYALMIDNRGSTIPVLVNGLLSLDSSGNLTISGGLTQHGTPSTMTATTANRYVRAWVPREADATIEDVGETTIRSGRALVALDPSFASTIDPRRPYYVFLTAEGESRGLYVTGKNARGFAIRETSGGASTLDVQYRIVAAPYDAIGKPRLAAIDATDMPYENARTRAHVANVRMHQARIGAAMQRARAR